MSSRIRVWHLSLVAILCSGACSDEETRAVTEPLPVAPTNGLVAYLTLSDQNPAVGSRIVVTARVIRASSVPPVGSFAARLRFDTLGLAFVEESPLSGGVRVMNAKTGFVAVAGASDKGFIDDRLFAVVLEVTRPSALRTLSIETSEMHATDFADQVPVLVLAPVPRFGELGR